MATKNINLEKKEIFDILVALKQRQASCQTSADEFCDLSLDSDLPEHYRKHYNDRFVAFSNKVKELTVIITKLEAL